MLNFEREGVIPAVVQDDETLEVLMVAFMNEEALQLTRETGYTHFYSRSRQTLWRKGEQSGNVQEVRGIFVNCEENSLLIRVVQHGGAACHTGYRTCYYRKLQPDGSYETLGERVFDPAQVYQKSSAEAQNDAAAQVKREEVEPKLERELRQLYGVYLYLRDHDMSEQSNTSRLLQEHSRSYLASRLADELQELAEVQSGEHVHSGRQSDTMLEGSQVGYWLLLLAATCNVVYDDFSPHASLLSGYYGGYNEAQAIEQRQDCLSLLSDERPETVAQGLHLGFSFIGWACAEAQISPLAPVEYDLEQMKRKGLA